MDDAMFAQWQAAVFVMGTLFLGFSDPSYASGCAADLFELTFTIASYPGQAHKSLAYHICRCGAELLRSFSKFVTLMYVVLKVNLIVLNVRAKMLECPLEVQE